jgi:putative oxidoreductase
MKKTMIDLAVWSSRLLAVLRMVAGLLLIEHAAMKFFVFPGLTPGGYPLPPIEITTGIVEVLAGTLILVCSLEPPRSSLPVRGRSPTSRFTSSSASGPR